MLYAKALDINLEGRASLFAPERRKDNGADRYELSAF